MISICLLNHPLSINASTGYTNPVGGVVSETLDTLWSNRVSYGYRFRLLKW